MEFYCDFCIYNAVSLLGVECVLYIKGSTAVLYVRKSQNPSQQEEKKKLNEEREKLT